MHLPQYPLFLFDHLTHLHPSHKLVSSNRLVTMALTKILVLLSMQNDAQNAENKRPFWLAFISEMEHGFVVRESWMQLFHTPSSGVHGAYLFMCSRCIALSRADRSGRACKLLYLDASRSPTLGRPQALCSHFLYSESRQSCGNVFFFLFYPSTCGSRSQCLWPRWFVIGWGSLWPAVYCWANYWCETGSWIKQTPRPSMAHSQLW